MPDRGPGASARLRLGRLTRRHEFLAAARSRQKCATAGIVVQARRWSSEDAAEEHDLRVGYTATKKIGCAVVRNRAKRRLRAVADIVLAQEAAASHDYVLIARAATPSRNFESLLDDMRRALGKLQALRPVDHPTVDLDND